MPPTPTPTPILIQVVGGEGAPWWGVPVIAGGFLILGALLGFLLNDLQESRRLRRENLTRWDERVLDGAYEVLSAVDAYARATRRLRDLIEWDKERPRVPYYEDEKREVEGEAFVEKQLDRWGRAEHGQGKKLKALSDRCGALHLIAPAKVRPMLADIPSTAAAAHVADHREEMDVRLTELIDASFHFEDALRQHFGLEEKKRSSRSAS